MSISSSTRKAGPYPCNGATVAFPFSFKVFQASDVRVVLTDSNSIEADLALGTNYTVALNANQDANPGGTVTTVATYAGGNLITLTSRVQNLQPVTLTNQGGFYPQVINDALDRLTIMVQQVSEQVGRAVKVGISSVTSPDQLISSLLTAVSNALTYSNNASNSATEAAGSATAASGSATAAANSATQAGNSAASVGFTLTSASTFQNKTTLASGGNTTEATSGPGASQLSLRNKIINGCCRVAQRGTVTISNAIQYGPVDRFYASLAGTGVSGTINRNTGVGANLSSGCGIWLQNIGCTGGYPVIGQRLEAANVASLNGKTITIKCKVYHDFGSAMSFGIVVNKANSADNFSSTTNVHIGGGVSCASGSYTVVSTTLTLGAVDANNGLEVNLQLFSTQTLVSKNVIAGDFQVEEGPVPTPFEIRPIQIELTLCQRYYEKSFPQGTTPAQNAGLAGSSYFLSNAAGATVGAINIPCRFKVTKRTTPTQVGLYNPSAANGQIRNSSLAADYTASTTASVSDTMFIATATGTAGTTIGNLSNIHWTAEAEL